MTPASDGAVTTSSTELAISINRLRTATEALDPISDSISVVSVLIRDSTSPVRVVAKNSGSIAMTRAYTSRLRSVTTR